MALSVAAHVLLYCAVAAKEPNLMREDKLAFKNAQNISDDKLIVDHRTFINDNGIRRRGEGKATLRAEPRYHPPNERALNVKILDMIRQSVYDCQDDMQRLDPILKKYEKAPPFRMAFIFDRLHQLVIDIRRVHTLAVRWLKKKRVYEQIVWYSHCVRKYVDVVYIVEHLIDSHEQYQRTLQTK